MKRSKNITHVNIEVQSENGTYVVKMTTADAKVLSEAYMRTGDWDDEINDIINRSEQIDCVGTINTMGDGGGWYE
jgi:hypothetical protein